MGSSQENFGGSRACKICIQARGNMQPLLRPDCQGSRRCADCQESRRCALVFFRRGPYTTTTTAAAAQIEDPQNVWVTMLAQFVLVFWRRDPRLRQADYKGQICSVTRWAELGVSNLGSECWHCTRVPTHGRVFMLGVEREKWHLPASLLLAESSSDLCPCSNCSEINR